MEARDVLPGGVSGLELGDDFIERQRGRIDDARTGWAVVQQRRRHERARVEAHGASRDEIASADGDEIRRTWSGADEVHGHGLSLGVRAWWTGSDPWV